MLFASNRSILTSFITSISILLFVVMSGCAGEQGAADSETSRASQSQVTAEAPIDDWDTFISPDELRAWQDNSNLVIVDARPAEKYDQGHIPGAINIPGSAWRTPSRSPGQGPSKYIFRTSDGSVDVQRYEQFLGEHGISNDSRVVVYGNHGGKKTGTVPVMILKGLGHQNAHFLDGLGFKRWKEAGYEVSTTPRTLEATSYDAEVDSNFVWNLNDVLEGIEREDVVIVDTRSKAEYTGENPRKNERAGHMPGAVRVNYSELMHWPERTTLPPVKAQNVLREKGLTGKTDSTYVLHCQTATRVSENYLVMKDLGYENVAVYDASWHEYGNREDTPIVQGMKTGG